MRKLVITALVLIVSLLAIAGAASAERGDIGGIGVGATSTTLRISK